MSGNPYSNDFDDSGAPQVERTSGLAITSLVLSLTCCLSPLGLLLGVVSTVLIGKSNGRLKGRGIAIAAIIVGLIGSALVGAAAYGASQMNSMLTGVMFGKVSAVMESVEAGDFDTARAELDPPLDTITDASFTEFKDAYQTAYGAYVGVPNSFFDSLSMYGTLGGSMQNYQGGQNVIPIPVTFANGPVLMVLELPANVQANPAPGASTNITLPLKDIIVVMPDGTELRLSDFAAAPASAIVPDPDATDPDAADPDATQP